MRNYFIVLKANTTVDKIEGSHMAGKTLDDVKTIYIANAECHFMPSGFEKYFKNLEGIQIYQSKLKAITQQDLRPFPNLKEIYLDNNQLTQIDSNLFEFNSKLRRIALGNNRIRTISVDVFDPLPDLTHVHFNSNVCISRDGKTLIEINSIELEIIAKCQPDFQVSVDLERKFKNLQKEFDEEKMKNEEKLKKICEFFN